MRILGGVNLPIPSLPMPSASFIRGVGKMGLAITAIALLKTAETAACWGRGGSTDLFYRTVQQCRSEASAQYAVDTDEWNTSYWSCFNKLMGYT